MGIKLGAGTSQDFIQCRIETFGQTVGAGAGHCRETVCRGNDPRAQRNIIALQPQRISLSVITLVVIKHHFADPRGSNFLNRTENRGPDLRMPADEQPFFLIQTAAFVQKMIRNADFSDVMKMSGNMNDISRLCSQTQRQCQNTRYFRYFQRMAFRVRVFGVNSFAQRFGKLMNCPHGFYAV